MAGLNDDIDEGLDDINEPDLINPHTPAAPKTTLITKTGRAHPHDNDPNHIKPSMLFGGPIVPGELPNFDGDFIVITDTANRISDNQAIKQTLKSSCSVCKEDAQLVNEVVPGFINEKRPLGFFTQAKSQVQLNETLNALDAQAETDIETLKSAVEANTSNMIERFKASFKQVEDTLNKSLIKYQSTLAKLVLMVDGDDTERTDLAKAMKWLAKTTAHNCDDVLQEYPALEPLTLTMQLPNFWRNVGYVVKTPDRTPGAPKHFDILYKEHILQDTEPFLNPVEKGTSADTEYFTLINVLYNGIDMYAIEYFNNLCQVAFNTTNAMGQSLAMIGELNKKEGATTKDKLDLLTQIASVNNKYANQNIAMLSFTKMYFDMVDSLFGFVMDLGTAPALAVKLDTRG